MTLSRGGSEQFTDEVDLASDASLLVVDMTAFDASHCLNAAEGRLCRKQRSETLSATEEPPRGGVVALDQVVSPLSVDVPYTVEMRMTSVLCFSDNAPMRMRFAGAGCDRPVQTQALDRLAQESPCDLCVTPRFQSEIDHLTVCIDRAPEVAPLAADPNVGLVHVPIFAGSA